MKPRLALLAAGVAIPSLAGADPVAPPATEMMTATAVASPPVAEPAVYVGGNTLAGFAPSGSIVVGVSIDGGVRIAGPLWGRAEFATGEGGELFGPNNTFISARGGLELRGCIPQGWGCISGGVDAGVNHYDWDRMTTRPTDESMLIPRVGIDLGTRRFRVRPAIDVPVDTTTGRWGFEARLGAAVQW